MKLQYPRIIPVTAEFKKIGNGITPDFSPLSESRRLMNVANIRNYEITKLRKYEIRFFGNYEITKFGIFPENRNSGKPETRKSGIPGFRIES